MTEKTIEQHRQEFEDWAKLNGYQRDELARSGIGIVSQEYFNLNTENVFKAWLAGRGIKE